MSNPAVITTIEPWLTVADGAKAIAFYTAAFGAIEKYKLDTGDGLVAQLAVDNASFWISGGTATAEAATENLKQDPIRLILTVMDPDARFNCAIQAGAMIIFPVAESHGWRLGRIADPFGYHWEIGHPLNGH